MVANNTVSFSYKDHRGDLGLFLERVKDILTKTVKNGTDLRGEFKISQDLKPYMEAAWREVEGVFQQVKTALENASDDSLKQHGLVGSQLNFKLRVFDRIYSDYIRHGGGVLLWRLFEFIDDLLKSILAALGISEALSEFKDAMKHSFEE